MIILGIDPGTALTGFGVISTNQPKHLSQNRDEKPRVVDTGCIITHNTQTNSERLVIIYDEINRLLKKYKPDLVSVESLFFFKNAKTAMPVAQARGVILMAIAQHNIPLVEFTPLQVKMTVTGYGRAEKKQIQAMTKQLLDMEELGTTKSTGHKKDDAADALGVALCAFLRHGSVF